MINQMIATGSAHLCKSSLKCGAVAASIISNGFHSSMHLNGGPRPWKDHTRYNPVIHQAQKGPEDHDIDFSSLNLKYPITHSTTPVVLSSWWTPPPEKLPDLPFFITRTTKGGGLPVYTDFVGGGKTKIVTLVRKCSGDIEALKDEIEKVCGTAVIVKPGKLLISGNYHLRLKKYFTGLGF